MVLTSGCGVSTAAGCLIEPCRTPERVTAQGLGALPSRHRQEVFQHAGGDPIGHEGRQMGLQLVQLWCRPAVRWPRGSRLGATTAGTEKARKPHRHLTEQCCDLM